MIIAKQIIKTNQVLSGEWSLSIGKIREKVWTNQQPLLKRYVQCAIQKENQQNQHRLSNCFPFHGKKTQRSPEDKVEWKQNYFNWNTC